MDDSDTFDPDASTAQSGQSTAKKAVRILTERNAELVNPTSSQRQNLLVAFAKKNKVVYGRAFDLVRLNVDVDLNDLSDVERNLDKITVLEAKATKKSLPPDFSGFFFALTAGEVLVAQSLKEQFRFIFVNTTTGSYLEMTLSEIFARARGIYPTWSISF